MDKEMTHDDDRELNPEAILEDDDVILADDILGDLTDDAEEDDDDEIEGFGDDE